jgi:hypothetical protein
VGVISVDDDDDANDDNDETKTRVVFAGAMVRRKYEVSRLLWEDVAVE